MVGGVARQQQKLLALGTRARHKHRGERGHLGIWFVCLKLLCGWDVDLPVSSMSVRVWAPWVCSHHKTPCGGQAYLHFLAAHLDSSLSLFLFFSY